jgi:molecular chaperone DnaJ
MAGGARAGGFGGAQGQGDFASAFSDVFEDLFGDFMGGQQRGGGRRGRASRGSDLRYNLKISLEDAYSGLQKQINVPTAVACGSCSGTGSEGGSEPVTCPTCSGMGKVRAQQGFFTVERTCPTCSGVGQIVKNPCKTCGGAGPGAEGPRAQRQHPRRASKPARASACPARERPACAAVPSGDLYIFIEVEDHALFQRDGMDLYCRVPVSMTRAALGGEVEVPTIDGGRSRVKVPEGSQSGRQMRLRGKGMPALRGTGMGDMYIELAVETPVKLTPEQKDLLRQFEESCAKSNNPDASGFFDKVRKFWDDLAN